jgi:hypothetical protein
MWATCATLPPPQHRPSALLRTARGRECPGWTRHGRGRWREEPLKRPNAVGGSLMTSRAPQPTPAASLCGGQGGNCISPLCPSRSTPWGRTPCHPLRKPPAGARVHAGFDMGGVVGAPGLVRSRHRRALPRRGGGSCWGSRSAKMALIERACTVASYHPLATSSRRSTGSRPRAREGQCGTRHGRRRWSASAAAEGVWDYVLPTSS